MYNEWKPDFQWVIPLQYNFATEQVLVFSHVKQK